VRRACHACLDPEDLIRRQLVDLGHFQPGQPGRQVRPAVTGPGCPDDDQPLAPRPASHESEHLLALRVKPLHVIDEDRHRSPRGGRIDQADRRQGDHVELRSRAVGQPERRQQGPAVRRREGVRSAEDGCSTWCSQANGNCISDSTPVAASTWKKLWWPE
jgi:hypothetical protein